MGTDNNARYYLHSSESMHEVEDKTVKLVITTPNHDEILNSSILMEIHRVLRDDGLFFFNVGAPVVFWETSMHDVMRPYRMAKDIANLTQQKLILRRDFILCYSLGQKDKMIFMQGEQRYGLVCTHQHFFMYSKDTLDHIDNNLGQSIGTALLIVGGLDKEAYDMKMDNPTTHPTPFEALAVSSLVKVYSNTGDLLLDPLAGNGTFGRVALAMGRRIVLYELMPHLEQTIMENIAKGEVEYEKTLKELKKQPRLGVTKISDG